MSTILIVEDEKNIASYLSLELMHEGYQVLLAADGREALEQAGGADLVLLDIVLPVISGVEVLRRLRRTSDVPIIMVTARGETFDKVSAFDLGADDYLVKPVEIEELLARIRRLDQQDGDLTSNLFATQGAFREDMIFNAKVFDQAKLVKEDVNGIAYTGLAYVDEDVKVLPIRLDDGMLVAPTYENVCNASWPLSRLCYINYNKAPDGEWDPITKEFLRFLLSRQAAEIIAEQNIYVPLTAKQANDARDIAGLPHEDYTLFVNGAQVETANLEQLHLHAHRRHQPDLRHHHHGRRRGQDRLHREVISRSVSLPPQPEVPPFLRREVFVMSMTAHPKRTRFTNVLHLRYNSLIEFGIRPVKEECTTISSKYQNMLSGKSVIRELSEYATARGQEIGYENVFDYSLGNPSVAVPKAYNDRLIELISAGDPMLVHGYSPSLGIPAVRGKIAASLNRRFGMNYKGEDIFMTSGAAGALAHAFRLVTAPGDEILTFAPFFPEYNPYVNLTGAKLRVVPASFSDFQINFDALEQMLTERVHAVLVNTPNNPSGAVYSAQTLTRLAELLTAKERAFGHEIWLISDEPYREIVFDGRKIPYVSRFYPRTLSCYSFSKSLSLPGDRIGYVAVNPACGVSAMLATMCGQISRGIGHNCPTALMQLAAADCCDMTADLSVYETNMNLLYDGLTRLGFEIVRPGGTFYMFPKALEADAVAFSKKAMRYDLILVPGDSFGAPGYFRIAYCVGTDKVERSLEAFSRFVKAEY